MNGLYIFWGRIRHYIVKNRGIFFLFLVGSIFNCLIVTYCYGNLVPAISKRNAGGSDYLEYIVEFADTPADIDAIEKIRQDPLIRACSYSDGSGVYTFDPNYPTNLLRGTVEFTDPWQVIVPLSESRGIGDAKLLGSEVFQIIGVASGAGYMIPEETFRDMGLHQHISRVYVYAKERQPAEDDRVEALIRQSFPNATDVLSYVFVLRVHEQKDSVGWMILITIQALMAASAYAFLLQYILSSIRKENVVCMILGASKLSTVALVFRDAVVFSVFANGIGVVLHQILYEPVFSPLNITSHLEYLPADYCVVLLLTTALSLATAIPVVLQEVLMTPTAAKRRNFS